MILKLFLLLYGAYIFAEIDRRNGVINYFNDVNNGRLDYHSVLMFLEDVSLNSCINYCIMHLQCLSVSYSSATKLCELNDIRFDEIEADVEAIGWRNYGASQKVHGNYSDWKVKTPCSTTCENGIVTYNRFCNNPVPQNGGNPCVGPDEKAEACFVPCPLGDNVAVGKQSEQISTYRGEERCKAYWVNDGNYRTGSCTSSRKMPWWQVDLGEIIRVRLITVNLTPYAYNNKYFKEVRVLTKTQEDSKWNICKNLVMFPTIQVNVTCESRLGETARYVRVQEMDPERTYILYLSEVEVYKW